MTSKAAHIRYNKSPKGLERDRNYRLGPKYLEVKRKYRQSPKGLETDRSYRHGQRNKNNNGSTRGCAGSDPKKERPTD
jgi:hypothetical protein